MVIIFKHRFTPIGIVGSNSNSNKTFRTIYLNRGIVVFKFGGVSKILSLPW
jgi:hypothetical protein